MRIAKFLLLAVVCLPFCAGCNGESASPPVASSAAPQDAATSAASQADVSKTVRRFWDSVKAGDVAGATLLLTPEAQKCIGENEYEFVPPASETMRVELGKVELVESGLAMAESTWHDVDVDGQAFSEAMSLALRRVNGEWRIFGMAAAMGPGEEPMIWDLEKPEGLFGPQQMADAPEPNSAPRQAQQQSVQDPFRQ